MAHYLTFSGNIYNVKVNDVIVSSGYELQDGDTIVINVSSSAQNQFIILNNEQLSNTQNGSTISLSDTDIDVIVQTGGGSND